MSLDVLLRFSGYAIGIMLAITFFNFIKSKKTRRAAAESTRPTRSSDQKFEVFNAESNASSHQNAIVSSSTDTTIIGRLRSLEQSKKTLSQDSLAGFGAGFSVKTFSVISFVISCFGLALASTYANDSISFFILFVPFAAAGIFFGKVGIRRVKTHRSSEQRKVDRLLDEGFVLYFRPFYFDLTTTTYRINQIVGTFGSESFDIALEEVIGKFCLEYGSGFRSIGQVENQFGPSALVTSDSLWMGKATEFMKDSALIIVVPGSSPGSFWEIEQIIKCSYTSKALFLMPPSYFINNMDEFAEKWNESLNNCRSKLKIPFPKYEKKGALFAYQTEKDSEMKISIVSFDLLLLRSAIKSAG